MSDTAHSDEQSKPETAWHSMRAEDICATLGTRREGLTTVEAEEHLARFGENKLPETKPDSIFRIFARQFESPLIYLLAIAAVVIYFIEDDWIDSAIIAFVLMFNAIVGTIQAGRAQNTLLALRRFTQTNATVVRDGVEIVLPDTGVVPGDIILLQEGEKVPADARIISIHNLRADEAALTGESQPVSKHADAIEDEQAPNADRKNMLFKGTHIVGGNAVAVVIGTGLDTLIGRISKEITEIDTEIPLQANIRYLTRIIIVVVLTVATFIFLLGFFVLGHDLHAILALSVAVVVSAIPEGLPIVMTLLLATGVWRMSKQNVLVKRLQAVEALGEAKVIAVDKTGTVTKNELVVQHAYADGTLFGVTGVGYESKGTFCLARKEVERGAHAPLMKLARLAMYTSDAQLTEQEGGDWNVSGDPTEAALLIFSKKAGFDRRELLEESPRIAEIPFDTKLKYHASLHRTPEGIELAVAGASEILLEKSSTIFEHGETRELTSERRAELTKMFEELSQEGLRVIALVYKRLEKEDVAPEDVQGMTVAGFVAMRDALRSEVHDAMEAARAAGVRVVMITGDHQETARAIARQAGIYQDGDRVLTGVELDSLDDDALAEVLENVSVFARVTPEHKLRIVQGYRLRGEIVAMTGDGVNDALSLVAADLGVSMGKNGTEVAKEASDLVLLDDNFGSIVAAIEEGRNIYKNIKKVILYLFSTSFGEVLFIIAALVLGYPLPILAAQLIWLNLVTDGFLTVALTMEPKEKALLREKFVRPGKFIVTNWMAQRMVIMSTTMAAATLVLFSMYYDEDLTKAMTIGLTTMAAFQWFKAWNCRAEYQSAFTMGIYTNKYLFWATGLVFMLHVMAVNTPFMQNILRIEALSLGEWILCISVATSTIAVDELRKYVRRVRDRKEHEAATAKV